MFPNPSYRIPIGERFRSEPSDRETTWDLGELVDSENSDLCSVCDGYEERLPEWEVIDAVVGGGLYIKEKCHQFLPQEPMEDGEAYVRRVSRSYFSPWYTRLRDVAIAQVLRRPIRLVNKEEAPIRLVDQISDIDLKGNDWNLFAQLVLQSAIDYGGSAILVDYPELPEGARTLVDSAEYRPYWKILCAKDIIDWHYEETPAGRVLTHVRFRQTVAIRTGRYRTQSVKQIRCLTLEGEQVQFEVWRDAEEGWVLDRSGTLGVSAVPVFPIFEFGDQPKMLDVALLNIKHYQRTNDRDHALHIAGNPKLALFGYRERDDISGGVSEAIVFDNPNGRMEWVTCASINFEAQEKHIEELVADMARLAMSSMLGQRNSPESGVSKLLDRTQSDSILSLLSQRLQVCYNKAIAAHCEFLLERKAPVCQVNRDFQVSRLSHLDIKTYSELVQLSQLPLRQFLLALQDGEWLEDEVNIDTLLEELNGQYEGQNILAPESEIYDDRQPDGRGGSEQANPNNSGRSE